MTLRHLKIFVAVCETGSTTAAGEKLFVAQPSVSLAISELEAYYGIKLFDRIAKRMQLTQTGRHFLQYATHIVSLFDSMEKEVKNFDTLGTIRIGASITIGNYLLPGYILAFKQQYPQMQVRVFIDNSEKIQQDILENTIDIGLVEGLLHNDYLIGKKFRDDRLVPICAAQHAFAGKEGIEFSMLQGENLLLREPGSAGREIFDSAMTTHGLSVTPLWESTSTQAIVRAVQNNLGISVLPYLLVKDALERGEVCRFSLRETDFSRAFCVIYHRNKFLTPSAKAFIALCK